MQLPVKCSYSELMSVEELKRKVNPLNPKKHPHEQITAFRAILEHQGIRRAIVVSRRSGLIVAGHGLLETLEDIGCEKAPIDFQDFNNEADELAHMVADNKLAELGYVNDAQINQIVSTIEEAGLKKELAGVLDELDAEAKEEKAVGMYELVPDFDEAYEGVLIFCRNGQEFAEVATKLKLGKAMNRKGGIGSTHVITAKNFTEAWNSK